MRIAMNLTPLFPGRMGGVETYARNLIEGLARLPHAHDYRILMGADLQGIAPAGDNRFSECVVESWLPRALRKSKYIRAPWQWLATARELRRYRPDVYHCPLNVPIPPWRTGANTIITLHDIKFMTNPEMLNHGEVVYWRYFLRRGMKYVKTVITISEFCKQTIVDYFAIDQERVRVVHNGIDTKVFRNDPLAAPTEKYARLPSPYLVFPALTWPYKNHVRLLQALALLRDMKRITVNLVLTGFPTTAHRDVQENLRKLGLETQVSWLGWVSSEELVYVYQNAQALIFPSLYEGFGLPIVEAMACGCPVLCSRTTACSEVAGDAALTFDPMQVEEMAARIETIWTDSGVRKELVVKGLARARVFACERMAEETLKVFASA